MKYEQLVILLPCHSLEDLSLHYQGDEAEGLLAGWSALWHPALLASAQAMPSWCRADDPPDDLAGHLVVIPTVAEPHLPAGLLGRAEQQSACLIRQETSRQRIVEKALESVDGGDAGILADLAKDFLALGFCYLQVELLTRQMRYANNLDETHFQTQLLAATSAALQDDATEAREHLLKCFDVLAEERDHYYPVDAYILDLTLVAPTTVGSSLRGELQRGVPVNLLMSADVLEIMAQQEPATLRLLQDALTQGTANIVGGELTEADLPLLPNEVVLEHLRRGLAVYQRHLDQQPRVFGRRRFGLTPRLPQILHKLGFTAALHATLDDGRFPQASQMKTRWEGLDGTAVDAVAKAPQDANRPETYLNYSAKLGESMDMDHVATVCLAHWPGQAAVWYDDLRRISSFVPVLGKFVSLGDYLENTELPGHLDRFQADQYRSPYLRQAVDGQVPDPLSSRVRFYRHWACTQAASSLEILRQFLLDHVAGQSVGTATSVPDTGTDSGNSHPVPDSLSPVDPGQSAAADEQSAEDRIVAATAALASSLPRKELVAESGYLFFNPYSFVRRFGLELPQLKSPPTIQEPVYAAATSETGTYVVVDVPPAGYAWVGAGTPHGKSAGRGDKSLAENNVLRNEHMEVHINETTGAISSLYDFRNRGNRLSQQLAFRLSPADGQRSTVDESQLAKAYSVMSADEVQVTVANPVLGEIVSRGRLLDHEGQLISKYEQTFRLWRGSQVLLFDIRLDPQRTPGSDPWNSYYACRFAWSDPGATLFRSVGLSRQATTVSRMEAPFFIEIEMPHFRTAILTGGLPYHRRIGARMIDSLLMVQGESETRFRMGIGIDVAQPVQHALALLAPACWTAQETAPPAPHRSGWLFHLDAKNVLATNWEAWVEGGQLLGFRIRLMETSGRNVRIRLDCFRPVVEARKTDFRNQPIEECEVNESQICVAMTAHEWTQIEARWR